MKSHRLAQLAIGFSIGLVGCMEDSKPSVEPPLGTPIPAATTGPGGQTSAVPEKPAPAGKTEAPAEKAPAAKAAGAPGASNATEPAPATAANTTLSAEEIAEIKKLPAEDQKVALEQKICPVGGGHLGDPDMGTPVKVTAKGETFFLCCGGCKSDVTKNPEKVLTALAAIKKK